jgi:pepF/M3 family oligoendopeptidase
MSLNWDLNVLYKDFDFNFQADIKALDQMVEIGLEYFEDKSVIHQEEKLVKMVINREAISSKYLNLMNYTMLRFSTNTSDEDANKYYDILLSKQVEFVKLGVLFSKWLKKVDHLEELIDGNIILRDRKYILLEDVMLSKYLLSDSEEEMYAIMQQFASSSWNKQESMITSTLEVDLDGEKVSLSEVRNLAGDRSSEVRKKAFDAELKSYEQIDELMALTLSNIKREVNYITKKRGYDDALDHTVVKSRMIKDTLDAMLEALKSYLPHFRRYLKAKAKFLGYEKLPFYELKAPVGNADMEYTYQQAQDLINENFSSFSKKLGEFSKTAFDNNWIDVMPKVGKMGGAFCANLPTIGESRILTNFDGSFDSVSTLAHELGHGYHGEVIAAENPSNWEYPMPLAETASILCETIVAKNMLKKLSDDELLFILEQRVSSSTQTMVDIYSRFLFESELLDQTNQRALSKGEMKKLMIDAQIKSYGDGLDPNCLHPYMWICKSHYYLAEFNFYNWPYAFGELFALGLYRKYENTGDEFIEKYDDLLKLTGKDTVENVALSMGIDVTQVDFWKSSLDVIKEDIEEVISLMEKCKH